MHRRWRLTIGIVKFARIENVNVMNTFNEICKHTWEGKVGEEEFRTRRETKHQN